MELKTFDTILNELCNEFDTLISPKAITRSNTNIIYLLFKAIAKGLEVINNTCVILNNKFDPARCEVEDLNSVANLVGTQRIKGSATGLQIVITNTAEEGSSVTLYKGMYNYAFDDDTNFVFEILEDTVLEPNNSISVIAMTEKVGSFPVTEQTSITVTSAHAISSVLAFSCNDNNSLLGTQDETDLMFRKRILEGYNNQDTIIELQNTIRNLPYIFDCRVIYNNTFEDSAYDDVAIKPFYSAIFYSGSVRSDLGKIIASKMLCQTTKTSTSVEVKFESPVFANGYHSFHLIPFKEYDFGIEVRFRIEGMFANKDDVQALITQTLKKQYTTNLHIDFVKESDIYALLDSLNMEGVEILDVNLMRNQARVNYFEVPISRVPHLTDVTFETEGE